MMTRRHALAPLSAAAGSWQDGTIGEALFERFNASRDQILCYYRSLINVLDELGPRPVADELARVMAELLDLVRKSETNM